MRCQPHTAMEVWEESSQERGAQESTNKDAKIARVVPSFLQDEKRRMDHDAYKRSDFLVRRRSDRLQHSRLAFSIQSEGTRQICHQPLLCVSTISVILISSHSLH